MITKYYIKICICIDSCVTKEHFDSCERLLEFFEFKFCKKNSDIKYSKGLLKNLIHKLCVAKDICNIYN